MANYFTSILGSGDSASLNIVPVNKGAKSYFRASGVSSYTIRPGEKVIAMVAPHSSPLSSGLAISLMKQSTLRDNIYSGYFFFEGGYNSTQQDDNLSFSDLELPRSWENTEFDLYWLQKLESSESYGTYLGGIYSYPHNIQPHEVTISGSLASSDTMNYKIFLSGIVNDSDVNYGSPPNDGPYAFKAEYNIPDATGDVVVPAYTEYIYYPSGVISSGISFSLPFHDPRDGFNKIPATYNFKVVYVSAGTDKPGSSPLSIKMDHANLIDSNTYFNNLDKIVFSTPEKENLRRVDEVEIPPLTIDRKRVSIGINDIAISDNTYTKQGTYVSSYYPLDFEIYTFSLRIKENIPDYGDLDPYSLVRYYAEFNNNVWERISPLERKEEYENSKLVPKMFIFDRPSNESGNENVKFINYGSVINTFRIKITFDLSAIDDNKFPPPEIIDYKCVIFNKNQFLSI